VENGTTATARLLKIEEDNSGDSTMYWMNFEYRDTNGRSGTIRIERRHRDLVVGQEVLLLIGQDRVAGLLERDLAGGMTFSNVSGVEPIRKMCIVRLLVIPALSAVYLLGILPQVASFYHQITAVIGYPIAYCWPVFAQAAWLFANNKHFMYRGTNLGDCSGAS